jgi:hypothetical protein
MAVLDGERGESAPVRNTIESLFQPDTIAPAEYYDGFKRKTPLEPERELVLAILEDAVLCFKKYLRSTKEKERRLFVDAEDWLFGDDREWALSFLNVCDLLGLEPGYLRKGLSQWKLKSLGAELSTQARPLNDTTETKQGGAVRGRQEERDPFLRRRHSGGRQPKRVDRRRARAGAATRLAAVRKARGSLW